MVLIVYKFKQKSYIPFLEGVLSSMMLRTYMFVDSYSTPPLTWQIVPQTGQVMLELAAAWVKLSLGMCMKEQCTIKYIIWSK